MVVFSRAVRLVLGLALCGLAGWALPAAAWAGSIAGTVRDGTPGHAAIPGIQVCQDATVIAVEESCTETDAAGGYLLTGLSPGAYAIHFGDSLHNRNYVDQFYGGGIDYPGTEVQLGEGEAKTGIDAEMHEGGSIAGTVTAVGGGAVEGLLVCAFANTAMGEAGRCTHTASAGAYAIHGLPQLSNYVVEFLSEDDFDYQPQYYDGAATAAGATHVAVVVGATTSGIDAELEPGAGISGTLTEVGTHRPLAGVEIGLFHPGSEELLDYVVTDGAGHYAFRGHPGGTYVVAFSANLFGPFSGDGYSTQYYKGAATFAAATPITIAPPEVLTGIDGEVVNLFPPPPPPPIQVRLVPAPRQVLHCRKGFHKRKFNGRARCVRVKHRHHRRHRHHGH